MEPHKETTLEELKKQSYQSKAQDTILMKDGKLDLDYILENGNKYSDGSFWDFEKILDNGTHVRIHGIESKWYVKKILKKGSLIATPYGYYASGSVKNIQSYPNRFNKGTSYWYNEKGQVNKPVEHDRPYGFIMGRYVTVHAREEHKKEDTYKILRWEDGKTKQPLWSIEVTTLKRDYNDNTVLTQYYKLNGNTGNIVEKKEQTYTHKEF